MSEEKAPSGQDRKSDELQDLEPKENPKGGATSGRFDDTDIVHATGVGEGVYVDDIIIGVKKPGQ